MKKSESLLWQRIKNLKLKGQIFRIESPTINGIPDVYWLINNKSIWIELKSNNVKNLGLSKYQINWHLTHFKNGGVSFILRGALSFSHSSEYQIFVIREPRTVIELAKFKNLEDAIKKIQA